MLDIKTIPTPELRGILMATEGTAGRDSEAAEKIRKELASRGRHLSEFIDRQSLIYILGTTLMALGSWKAFGDGWCFIVGGLLLILPILVPLIPRRPLVIAPSPDERSRSK
jgi:hypothetical protein